MSASVFKPLRFEMTRIRGVSNANQALNASMGKVRRALFGPVDPMETEKFLLQELALNTHNECNKWEFDFRNGVPFNLNNNKGRFDWKPVVPMKITHAPKKRLREEEECFDNSDLYPRLPEKVVRLEEENPADTKTPSVELLSKRQTKITDFMQSRKRPADLTFITKKTTSSLSSCPHLTMQQTEKS